MKQGKRETKRDRDIERETEGKRGLHTGTNCVMQARSVASKTAGQCNSLLGPLQEFQFSNCCPAKRSDYATRIRKQSSLLLCQAAETFASTFSLLQAKSLTTCGCLPSCHGSSKLILFFTCFPAVFSTDFMCLSLSLAATKCLPYSERSACCCCRPH